MVSEPQPFWLKPFWFKLELSSARAGKAGFRFFFSVCILVRRRSMPRRGWSSIAIPNGWYEVIRGLLQHSGFSLRMGRARARAKESSHHPSFQHLRRVSSRGPSRSCIAGLRRQFWRKLSRWRTKMFRNPVHPQQRIAEASARVCHWPESLPCSQWAMFQAIRLGRLTALSKPDGGVRGRRG